MLKVQVLFNSKLGEVINKQIDEDEAGPPYIHVLRTRLTPNSRQIYDVLYTQGPSADPGFLLFKEGETKGAPEFQQCGLLLVIPGNGNLYISGHTNNYYDQKKKFVVKEDQIQEVKQPFYYVGLQSRALRDVTITSDKSGRDPVAHIPKGGRMTVLIDDDGHYLLKTPFGLLGWLHIEQKTGPVRSSLKGSISVAIDPVS